MNYFETWNDAVFASLQDLWAKVVAFIPELLGAFLVLVIGLLLSRALSELTRRLVKLSHIDELIEKMDGAKKLKSAGLKANFSGLLAWIVKWFFVTVTLIAAVDILRLTQVTNFLQDVAMYIPNVIVAVLILAIGLVVGQFIYDVIEKTAKTAKVVKETAQTLASVAKWAITIFAVLAALVQLGVATNLIEILFTGFIAAISLAFGLSFGLGGREHASKWLTSTMAKKK